MLNIIYSACTKGAWVEIYYRGSKVVWCEAGWWAEIYDYRGNKVV